MLPRFFAILKFNNYLQRGMHCAEPFKTSGLEFFINGNSKQPSTNNYFTKRSILDVLLGSQCTLALLKYPVDIRPKLNLHMTTMMSHAIHTILKCLSISLMIIM